MKRRYQFGQTQITNDSVKTSIGVDLEDFILSVEHKITTLENLIQQGNDLEERLNLKIEQLQAYIDRINTIRDQEFNRISNYLYMIDQYSIFTDENDDNVELLFGPVTYVTRLGFDSIVRSIYFDSNEEKLYIGGTFRKLDNGFLVNNIVEWDYHDRGDLIYTGQRSNPGIVGNVYTISRIDDFMIAGGDFGLYYYDTNIPEWTKANTDTDFGTVTALFEYNSNLYIGGDKGLFVVNTNLNDLRQITDKKISSIATENNNLYIASKSNIFVYDNDIFSLKYDIGANINALYSYSSNLYIGTDNGLYENQTIKLSGNIYALSEYNSNLYIGGDVISGFSSNLVTYNIVNGQFKEISNFNAPVYTIEVLDFKINDIDLVIGGSFQDGVVTVKNDQYHKILPIIS